MRGSLGHWTVVLLIAFNVAALGYATVWKYDLISQEDNSLQIFRSKVSCTEELSGKVTVSKPVEGAKTIVSLEYSTLGRADEKTIQPVGGSYAIRVNGKPTSGEMWTLRAFYYDKTGQLSETAQQFDSVGCDQEIKADLELKAEK